MDEYIEYLQPGTIYLTLKVPANKFSLSDYPPCLPRDFNPLTYENKLAIGCDKEEFD